MYTKESADRFIEENKHLLRQDYRLQYHLMAEYGWMNDPNGFIHYGGMYHLFYQHYPYEPYWGPMHWGHAVSRDLIRWDYLPVALAPGEGFDKDGCFSGSAIEHEGRLVLMYTGHTVTGPDKDRDYKQAQGLAVSEDGVRFDKWVGNPVIRYDQIPDGVSRKDFRDPKVFRRDGHYYTVLGSNDGRGRGLVLLYRSDDLTEWEFVSIAAMSDGTLGDNWECPDLLPLGGRDVLILSPQRVPSQGNNYRNLHSTTSMIGKLDLESGKFSYDHYCPVDYGFDFYAPQTASDPWGRRIVIGWMDMWENEMPTQRGHGWAGAMTLPREILQDGDRLIYRPVGEIVAYRRNPHKAYDVDVEGERVMKVSGDSYELKVVFDAGDALEFGLKLRTGGDEETVLSYRPEHSLFRFNRDRSGIGPGGERRASVELEGGKLALRIFVDRSSVEVFIGRGEKVMTGRIYPGERSLGIKAYAVGACRIESFEKWDIG
ncbi:glycoside hydrolase family 32 protein [Paenibacillus filicis]|uniref:Sucrose-6-phosphate hydrolase n=1 Tax=Paenibacillus gyeongsangnamensis TaxID=3388067 RepID=A0ABT4QBC2_9BACL|nr:glycoside hydrolase family 32 protein [Paenibacillus filicis]MCZ8514187.1 glycoside hydrolase family 32 protein [Paenibacillus filicis]